MKTSLYLLRHGEVHNPQKILYGRMPGYKLSEAGKAQARAAGKWLAGKAIEAIYCSPMQRAQETATIVAEALGGIAPSIDQRLMEVHTPYEGHLTAELANMGWDLYTGNQPPYETPQIVLERVLDFFAFVWARHAGKAVAAVGHGDILVFPWLHAQGQVPEALMKDRLQEYGLPVDYPATASIMRFDLTGDARVSLPTASYHCPY
ncbi:MAG: histidine phosphatase family protein [Chloroflexi bacterium]|nr:histidine phosphatase family protein [Chloroflexota bacterium]MCY3715717.1 histidine phosphatase family protein [Chloroflexota bacterium]MYE78965.1 histidine phosphatase family protein [Chloroflexota bacterium]MYH64546.1 histidine phosphatase family protein [Chloroflexota bacterium]